MGAGGGKSTSGSGSKGKSKSKSKSTSKSKRTIYYSTSTGTVGVRNPGTAPAAYKSKNKAPVYTNNATAPAAFVPGQYNSEYAPRISEALDKVTNWSYDPMQDASYQALAKVYGARGNIAAKNSMADAAALNGGYGTSYAVSAAQQARNQYNQELASYIPQLESSAYQRAAGTLDALRAADDTAYGRFRDTESDRQWVWSNDYQKWRDLTSDNQWKYTQDYQKYRDKEADSQWAWTQKYNRYRDLMSDYQWGLNYNYQVGRDKVADSQWAQQFAWDKYQYEDSKKDSSGGGGGGSSGGGGGGYSSGGGSSSSGGGGGGNPYNYDDAGYGVSRVHQWDKKNKKILDKTVAKKINTYSGKGR